MSRAPSRLIDDSIPRRVILFGSLQWSAKQANLRLFLDATEKILVSNDIQVQLVGDIPKKFGDDIAARYKAVDVVGYVEEPTSYLANARLAVIAEPIGGGFKMKILDYIFNRVPVLALNDCIAGLPPSVAQFVFTQPDLEALSNRLVDLIDDDSTLNKIQNDAYEAALTLFNWEDRGKLFRQAIEQVI